MGGNQDTGTLGEIPDEGGRDGDLGLPDIVGAALGGSVEIDHDRERGGFGDSCRSMDPVEDVAVFSRHPAIGEAVLVFTPDRLGLKGQSAGQEQQGGQEASHTEHKAEEDFGFMAAAA